MMAAAPTRAARIGLLFVAAALTGAIAAATASGVASAVRSEHAWWYMGRASGFVAFGVLLASMLLGLGISSRVFDGLLVRSWVFDMHEFTSIFVLVAILSHALVLLPDPYTHFSLAELLVPFASPYRPIAVGAGVLVLYGLSAVAVSYYLKRWIGQERWRWLHYASFALFAGALVHGVAAGADSRETWAQLFYLACGLATMFFTFFRILAARSYARRDVARAAWPAVPPGG